MQNSHIYWLYAFILGNIIEKVFSFGSVEDWEGNGEKKFFIVNLSFWKRVFIMYTYIFFSYRKIVTTFLLIVGLINKFLHIIFNIRIKLPNLNDDVIKKYSITLTAFQPLLKLLHPPTPLIPICISHSAISSCLPAIRSLLTFRTRI